MHALKNLYKHCFRIVLRTPSGEDMPEHIAGIFMALLLTMNVYTIYLMLEDFRLIKPFNNIGVLLIGVFVILNYVYVKLFVRSKYHLELKDGLDKDVSQDRNRSKIIFLLYLVTSVASVISFGIYQG